MRVWIDVGSHLGEKTFEAARTDPGLIVYAFEPNLELAARNMGRLANFVVLPMAVSEVDGSVSFYQDAFDSASSMLAYNSEGLARWTGGDELRQAEPRNVPSIRLDTFLDRAGIGEVEFLKIDAQGADLAVVRSLGGRLSSIRTLTVEVQVSEVPLYDGACTKEEVLSYLGRAGFRLVSSERQSHGQEENLTFERGDAPLWSSPAEALADAARLSYLRPLTPYPGWTFGVAWNSQDAETARRRAIWEYFHNRRLAEPVVFRWLLGTKIHLYLGNDLSLPLFIGGAYEPNEFHFLSEALPDGGVFVDVGANDGFYSVFAAARCGPTGRVLAIEPSSRERERFERNVALNNLKNVSVLPYAAGAEEAEAELLVAGYGHEGHNTLGTFAHDAELQSREKVRVRPLDAVIAEAGVARVDAIKIDVEGGEAAVLRGAAQTIARFRPAILFEVSPTSIAEVQEFFAANRYRLLSFDSATGLPAPWDRSTAADNLVALPEECALAARYSKGSRAVVPPRAFSISEACWNQRVRVAELLSDLKKLAEAVGAPNELNPYQWGQLYAACLDYQPDLILELGRARGNATALFTDAAARVGKTRVVSVCPSKDWERHSVPRLQRVLPRSWFAPLQTIRGAIRKQDYRKLLEGSARTLVYVRAEDADVPEALFAAILPILAERDHVIVLHNVSDIRYNGPEHLAYNGAPLWLGSPEHDARFKIGDTDSSSPVALAALDFTTRNRVPLESADHDLRSRLSGAQAELLRSSWGDFFDVQAHWAYFRLNGAPRPFTFPAKPR